MGQQMQSEKQERDLDHEEDLKEDDIQDYIGQ